MPSLSNGHLWADDRMSNVVKAILSGPDVNRPFIISDIVRMRKEGVIIGKSRRQRRHVNKV